MHVRNLAAAVLLAATVAGCGAQQAPIAGNEYGYGTAPAPQPAPAGSAPAASAPPASAPAASAPAPVRVVEVTVEATEESDTQYVFQPSTITVPAGARVQVTFKNTGTKRHDFGITGWSGAPELDAIEPGATSTLAFTAPDKPGEYSFVCSLRGHKDKGMRGTLVVTG